MTSASISPSVVNHGIGNSRIDLSLPPVLWHCTDWPGFRGIIDSRQIRPNLGDLRFRHGLSHLGYAHKSGSVALFDGAVEPERSLFTSWSTAHRPITFVFRVSEAALDGHVIRRKPQKDSRGITVRGEVWFPGVISWTAITGCLLVRAAVPEQKELLRVEEITRERIAEVIHSFRPSCMTGGRGE